MFACLHLPQLPAEAILAQHPDLRSLPCAVVANESQMNDPRAPLLAVNFTAERNGIRVGKSSIHARTQCPDLRLLSRNLEAEQKLQRILLTLAESLSPDFEHHRPGTLIIDLAGCRSPTTWNPPIPHARLVFAETPDLAHLAAMVDTPFSSRAFELTDFDTLPLTILPLMDMPGCNTFLPVLHLWGLRSLGEFRRLPRQEITERIGPDAMHLHDVIHGKTRRLLKLHRPIESFVQNISFEPSIESLEALIFRSNRMLQTLCARLEANHRAAGTLRFALSFESSERMERTLVLPEPLSSSAAILRPLHTALETLRVPSGIIAMELELNPVLPLAAQREYIGRQLRQPARWPDTLARLDALLGPGRVGIPQPEDNHRPDAFKLRPVSGDSTTGSKPRHFPTSPLPLRRFRPPLDVAVASSAHDSRPQALLTGPHPGPITGLRGPFPLSGDWWKSGDAWQRLEWDIELDHRHLFRLVHVPPDQWLLDGAYA